MNRNKKHTSISVLFFLFYLPTGSMTESSLGLISPSIALEPNKIHHFHLIFFFLHIKFLPIIPNTNATIVATTSFR